MKKKVAPLGTLVAIFLVLPFFVLPTEVFAQSLSKVGLHGDFTATDQLFSQSAGKLRSMQARSESLSSPITFSGDTARLGRFRGSLNVQRSFEGMEAYSDIALLQGSGKSLAKSGSKDILTFGTLQQKGDSKYSLRLFMLGSKARHSRSARTILTEIEVQLAKEGGRIEVGKVSHRRSKIVPRGHSLCLSDKPGEAKGVFDHDGASTKVAGKAARALVEYDYEYGAKVASADIEVMTIMNAVDAIYKRDLTVALDSIFLGQAPYAQPIQLDNNFNFPIHTEMAQRHPAATRGADVHVLFTGKDPIGSDLEGLLGAVPEIGVVCDSPSSSVEFTIRYDTSEDILTAAHEVGHLFGGTHDDDFTSPSNPGIMNSGTQEDVTGEITSFSSYSVNQIGNYVAQSGSCLMDREIDGSGGGGGGGSGSVTLEAYRDGRYIGVYVHDGSDTPLSGESVELVYARKKSFFDSKVLARGTSDEDGYFERRARKKGFYRFQTGSQLSKIIKVR